MNFLRSLSLFKTALNPNTSRFLAWMRTVQKHRLFSFEVSMRASSSWIFDRQIRFVFLVSIHDLLSPPGVTSIICASRFLIILHFYLFILLSHLQGFLFPRSLSSYRPSPTLSKLVQTSAIRLLFLSAFSLNDKCIPPIKTIFAKDKCLSSFQCTS